jgi:DNA-directed RNA polymerase subunit beta'
MAYLDPDQQFEIIAEKVSEAVGEALSVETKKSKIVVHSVEVKNNKKADDFRDQKKAIRNGKSWQVPILADMSLMRRGRGGEMKEIDRKKVVVGHVPRTTGRFGYIHNGNEYQIFNQLRLRPGVYHRRSRDDKLYSEFNLSNQEQLTGVEGRRGRTFKMELDPKKAIFFIHVGTAKLPAYHLLKSAGVSDDELERTWGKRVLDQNRSYAKPKTVYGKFYKAVHGSLPENPEEHEGLFGEHLERTRVDEKTTKTTLGRGFKALNGDALLASSSQLLKISKGEREPDNKSSMEFQTVNSAEDLLSGRINRDASAIQRKIRWNIDKRKSIKKVIPSGTVTSSIKKFFQQSLANEPDQTNPLGMLAGQNSTTIMGEQGGIGNSYAVLDEAKMISASQFGFIDPVRTPEGEKTGVTLSLALGTRRKGDTIVSKFRDAKTGRLRELSPSDVAGKVISFHDQYDGKKPKKGRVKALRDGEIAYVSSKEVDYILPSPRAVFGVSSNLVPFLQNNQGNRAMTAAKQQEQAVPLKEREAPLVQVQTDGDASFEEIFGHFAARRAPISGTIDSVRKDAVIVKDRKGKKHEVQFYRDFALPGGSLYDSEVKVKAGDKVGKGDLLVDSTFTKDGTLALGTNLRAAYIPFQGYNFEDGIVISEAAAKKLTSLHVHPKKVLIGQDAKTDRKTFLSQYPGEYNQEQLKDIDEKGTVTIGTKVVEGDPLVLVLKPPSPSQQLKDIREFRRGRKRKFRNRSISWDKPYPGVVSDVVRRSDGSVVVYVKTEEPAQIGDKLVGRHGNKGVITRIVPDAEMPFMEEDGEQKHVEIALNPMGVPGRINLGQVLETAAGKIAKKAGKPYRVRNFEAGRDYLKTVKEDLARLGLTDKESLINPKTNQPFDQDVLTGQQYIVKLKHQAGKKIGVRSGDPGAGWDVHQTPSTGGDSGRGQSLGELGMYAMLAHGSRDNLHEMFAYKSTRNDSLWDAIRDNKRLPPAKTPFAYDKFENYLRSMRVNPVKEGSKIALVPFTESQVKKMSSGELKRPNRAVMGKDIKPEAGGLFDPAVTGGLTGTRWSHIELAEPLPNPLFAEAVQKVLNIDKTRYRKIIAGEVKVDGKRGGEAIEAMLQKVDVKAERKELEAHARRLKAGARSKVHKRLRVFKMLDENKLDPTIYMMRSVPVLPPIFRPPVVNEDGSLSNTDLNYLYKDLGTVNGTMAESKKAGIPSSFLNEDRVAVYDALAALNGNGPSLTREYRGVLDIISGQTKTKDGKRKGTSKNGYFQKTLIKRRQAYSGRSIITPEPHQGIDELGVPEKIAWGLYSPYVQRELVRMNWNPLDAREAISKKSAPAKQTLERVMKDRPILLKRDPSLHKFNVMAFKGRIVKGNALEIHPLVTSGYNADFDGDAMSVYLPVTTRAVREATQMFPSNNLFNPTDGSVMYTPGHEALLGIYLASKPGEKTDKKFKNMHEARRAKMRGEINLTDQINVGGDPTTLGRMEIEDVLPNRLRETGKKPVKDMRLFDKKGAKTVLTDLAKNNPDLYAEVSNRFKDIGNDHSYEIGFSIGLDDFNVVNKKERDQKISAGQREADRIRGSHKDKRLGLQKAIEHLQGVDDEIDKLNDASLKRNPTNISEMVTSGSRGKPEQLKQIISTPALVMDAQSRVVPFMIDRSYSEGMDLGSYWTTMHGARKGAVQKVQGVRDPGYLSKRINNTTMDTLVTKPDCGTGRGIDLGLDNRDLVDRYLSSSVKLDGTVYKAGTMVTPGVISAARKSKKKDLPVRSPLRCRAKDGVCQKCLGLDENNSVPKIGTNIGIIAGQSIGEPSVQLSLNTFHTGGIAKGRSARSANTFQTLNNLLTLPKTLPDAATLSHGVGTITSIKEAPQGGWDILIGKKKKHYVRGDHDLTVTRGQEVRRGDRLSSGTIDPLELIKLRGVSETQDHLSHEIEKVIHENAAPVRRRNIEVVVRAITNLAEVDDPGDNPDWSPGDMRRISEIEHWNDVSGPSKKNAKFTPTLKGVGQMPLSMQEDWMARLNFQKLNETMERAVREGWKSDIHGFHPIPAAAHASEFGRGKEVFGDDWAGQY